MLTNTATGSLQFTHFSKPPRNTLLITQPETGYIATSLPSCVPSVLGSFLHSPFPFLWPGSQCFNPLPCPRSGTSGSGRWLGRWVGGLLHCVRKEEKRKMLAMRSCSSSLRRLSLRAFASATLAKPPWSSLCPGSG